MRRIIGAAVLTAAFVAGSATTASAASPSCWGQASAVFAPMGLMGEHASTVVSGPRVGLRNLARSLHEGGFIDDDSMASLGAFVAAELELSIDACN